MHVLDHEPHAWFLYERDGELLLDVNCSHGAAGYGVLIRLSSEEVAGYAREGHPFLDRLAESIQNSGPGQGRQRRDVTSQFADECARAFEDWWRLNAT